MTMSINTNAAALNALLNLNKTTRELNDTQLRVNTGLEVRNAKDNAAVFAIAQNMRAEKRGLDAVKQSLDRSKAVLDVTMAAAESIQDILIQMKEKVVAAADAGLDTKSRDALQQDFNRLRDQITTMAANASFNGTNMIDGPAALPTKPANLIALVSADATLDIEIPRQDMALKAAGTTTFAPTDIVQLATDSTFTTAAQAQTLIGQIDTSIRNMSQSLTVFGAGAKSIENQRVFVDKLSDTIETGIGNLVDADMARESARLQALQVKQQLGTQALSIANGQPQSILSLFRQ
jgi:flagellin